MKKTKSKEQRNEMNPAMKEWDKAWKEFFKGKPEPKNDKGLKNQMEEFRHWYNNERRQSDTGKTPAEMYKEIYGKVSPKNLINPSRIANFVWDENYKEPDEMMAEADKLIGKGKYEEALKILADVHEIIGDEEEVLLMKAEVLNILGKSEEAENCLRKIGKESGYEAYISFYRSQRYFYDGNIIRALKYMKEAYEEDPEDFNFVIALANQFYLINEPFYDEFLNKARNIDKKRTEKFLKKFWLTPKELLRGEYLFAVLDCADKLMEEGQTNEAAENLEFLIKNEKYLEKEIIKVIRGLHIECLLMQKNYSEALDNIQNLINIDKNNPHAYFYKAQLNYENSKFDEALKEIDKCLQIAEKTIPHPDFYKMKAIILKELDSDEYIYYENKANALMKAQGPLREFFTDLMEKRRNQDC